MRTTISQSTQQPNDGIESIPETDRRELRQYFDLLLIEGVGFAIFGKKPMSSMQLYPCAEFENALRGVATFEKHAALFPTKNLVMRAVRTSDSLTVYCINKRECERVILENPAYFNLQDESPEAVREIVRALKESSPIEDAWQDNRVSQGILYGYGLENATHCDRLLLLRRAEAEQWDIPFSEDFVSAAEELRALEGNLRNFCKGTWTPLGSPPLPHLNEYKRPTIIMPPQFFGMPDSEESIAITTHFRELVPRLQQIKDGNILEEVWRQFQVD